jgi:hypothetical protein
MGRGPSWQLAAEPVTAGPDGRFVFYGLEEGLYTADTWLYGEVIHNGELPDGTVLARRAGPRFQDSEFMFRATPRPSVDGIVRDEHGDPVRFVNVWAFRNVWVDGHIVQSRGLPVTTDDRGYYRISALSPGAYMVCAEFMDAFGNEWHRTVAPETSSVVDYGARSATRFYRRSCYPGPPPASFKIEWGQSAHADLKLGSTPVTKVRGRVSDWDPRVAHISLLPEDETASSPHVTVQTDGAFEFDVLEPGRYVLRTEKFNPATGAPGMMAQQPVLVENTTITGLQLAMQPVSSIHVLLQAPPEPALKPDSVSIGLRAVSSGRSFVYWAQRANDGSFSFPAIDPGNYWLLTRTEDPFCIDSITVGGHSVLHGTVSISPGESQILNVVLSIQCAKINGQLIMPEHTPPFAVIAILMSGTPTAPGDVLNFDAAEDGSFTFDRLPPGRYLLWAWSQGDSGYAGPASLADVASQASVVEVAKGQPAATQVRLLQTVGEAAK